MTKSEQRDPWQAGWGLLFLASLWVLGIAAIDSHFRLLNINRATNFSLTGENLQSRKALHDLSARNTILPLASVDSRWWVMHADSMRASDAWRVRTTDRDNAPQGREVHWSSSIIWILAALGHLTSSQSTDAVSLAVGPLLFLISLALCWFGILRHLDKITAAFLLLALGTNVTLFQAFQVGETDHHGLAAMLVALCLLAFVLAGMDVSQPHGSKKKSRAAQSRNPASLRGLMDFSAICGAAGLWLSASSTLPLILSMGVFGVLLQFVGGDKGVRGPDPILWRRWGLVGGGFSLGFYLLEYFPFQMGLRLEVNHPLYALAWAGGGEFVYRILQNRHGGKFHKTRTGQTFQALSMAAVVAPALIILFDPSSFVVRDPFLADLHRRFIVEFQGLLPSLNRHGSPGGYLQVFLWPVTVSLAFSVLLFSKKLSAGQLFAIGLPAAVASAAFAMAFVQQRWLLNATALWIVAGAVILKMTVIRIFPSGWALKGLFLITCILSFVYFPMSRVLREYQLNREGGAFPKEWLQVILLRDVSQRIAQSMNGSATTILSGPTASTDLAFFGNHRVIGTLYWENLEGLRRAATLFSMSEENEVKQTLEKTGVTHVILPSWDDFGAKYSDLLSTGGSAKISNLGGAERHESGDLEKEADPSGSGKLERQGYLNQVLHGDVDPPDWLRPLYYPIPKEFALNGESILIFQVLPNQESGEALYYRALDYFDRQDFAKAYEFAGRILNADRFYEKAEELRREIRGQFLPR